MNNTSVLGMLSYLSQVLKHQIFRQPNIPTIEIFVPESPLFQHPFILISQYSNTYKPNIVTWQNFQTHFIFGVVSF